MRSGRLGEAHNTSGNKGDRTSALLDAAELVLECGFNAWGAALAAGNAADVGAIDSELTGDTSVQAAVKAVSRQRRIFAMIPCHQR
jgi:hypothetical protein